MCTDKNPVKRSYISVILVLALIIVVGIKQSFGSEEVSLIKLPIPFKNAKVGQWVTYRVAGKAEQKTTIMAIETIDNKKNITVQVEQKHNDKFKIVSKNKIDIEEIRNPHEKKMQDAGVSNISTDNIYINGKVIHVTVIAIKAVNGEIITVSDDVPIYGDVKIVIDGLIEPVIDLIDFQW